MQLDKTHTHTQLLSLPSLSHRLTVIVLWGGPGLGIISGDLYQSKTTTLHHNIVPAFKAHTAFPYKQPAGQSRSHTHARAHIHTRHTVTHGHTWTHVERTVCVCMFNLPYLITCHLP